LKGLAAVCPSLSQCGKEFAVATCHQIGRNAASSSLPVAAPKETILRFILLTAALLIPASVAIAQDAAPAPSQVQPAAPVARPVVRKPAPVRAAAVPKAPDTMEISQIDGIRQVDPATYEIDGRTPNGTVVMLRMNAFVMQDLGRRLGTYGH
jgi:hypothetical protein